MTASLKLHEAPRKTLQKPNPASEGNDATAGMPPVDRAADELHAAPASIIEREAGQTVGMPSADRAAAEVQAAPLNVVEREAEQTVGMPSADRAAAEVQAAPLNVMEREAEQTVSIDRSATEVQDASLVIERKGIPNIGTAVGRALIAVMETYQQQGGSIAVPLVRIVMLVAGFGIYMLFVIRVVIPLVCHTRL